MSGFGGLVDFFTNHSELMPWSGHLFISSIQLVILSTPLGLERWTPCQKRDREDTKIPVWCQDRLFQRLVFVAYSARGFSLHHGRVLIYHPTYLIRYRTIIECPGSEVLPKWTGAYWLASQVPTSWDHRRTWMMDIVFIFPLSFLASWLVSDSPVFSSPFLITRP